MIGKNVRWINPLHSSGAEILLFVHVCSFVNVCRSIRKMFDQFDRNGVAGLRERKMPRVQRVNTVPVLILESREEAPPTGKL